MANDQLNHRALPITIKRGIFLLLFYAKALDTYPFTCTFETNDHCFLIQDTSDDFDWTFPKTGDTDSSNTGPESAVAGEAYAYIETNWPRQDGDVAILSGVFSSPLVNPLCLTFAYHMYGNGIGTLNVSVKSETGTNIVSWSKSGNQGNLWYGEVIEIQSPALTSKIVFEGVTGKNRRGDIAIDNVTLSKGACALDQIPHRCTFEKNDQCFLRQETDDDFDWTVLKTSNTNTPNTGPQSAVEGEAYAYIETNWETSNGDVAILYRVFSPPLVNPLCLTFAYHMYGNGIGTLNVSVKSETGTNIVSWSKSGNQGNLWYGEVIEIQSPALTSKIVFEGVTGKNRRGDIAIDNVTLSKGACALDQIPHRCTFEKNDQCFLRQETDDDFDWTVLKTSNTNTPNTGPQSAVEGEAYAYIETNWETSNGDVAILYRVFSPPLVNPLCLTFAYHMYGNGIGTLNVFVKDETGANIVSWSKSGNQGNLWYGEVIEIQSPALTSKIVFQGVTGKNRRGDIAIDNVTLSKGACALDQIPHRCTFEKDDQCFLRQETDDDFDWTFPMTGKTSSADTGPNDGMEGTPYAYIQATDRRTCDVAVLSSERPTLVGQFCLNFAYNMNGRDMGKLNVFVRDETGLDVIKWSKSGNQGSTWFSVRMEIPSSVPSSSKRKIIFEGVTGEGVRSDAAVDNIILTPGTCEGTIWGEWSSWGSCSCGTGTRVKTRMCSITGANSVGCRLNPKPDNYTQQDYCNTTNCPEMNITSYQCTFEASDQCFLTQEPLDDFDWTFSQTDPLSVVEGSSYAYIETSSPTRCCDVAILSSHRITMAGSFCLTFAYLMYDNGIGSLNVFVKDENGTNIGGWSKSGDQDEVWHNVKINIAPSTTSSFHKVVFKGTKGPTPNGVTAIDNITLMEGLCVDGAWGLWKDWTTCSVTCGNGTKSRTRECAGLASNRILQCSGESNETDWCTQPECPVDEGWATWRTWSACAVVNTEVIRSRCRECTNSTPAHNGAPCPGESLQSEQCPDPIDTFKRKCRCRRRRVPVIKNYTKEELATAMEETKKALTVDKTKTSMSIRKKISAPDDRKSSAAMASVLAVVLLSIPVIFIVSIDMMNVRYFNGLNTKKKMSVRPNGNKVGNDIQSIEMQEKEISTDV
ncbi:MAM and LDL-receptor class A domain-containing protein 1-like [Argopecten irradians]|uniref:MAM and LDL-receptor class A domain-containing protein 1-like n=1 Tax=Argopecten irradians TaxID=31199 RepID=UPI003711ADA5